MKWIGSLAPKRHRRASGVARRGENRCVGETIEDVRGGRCRIVHGGRVGQRPHVQQQAPGEVRVAVHGEWELHLRKKESKPVGIGA